MKFKYKYILFFLFFLIFTIISGCIDNNVNNSNNYSNNDNNKNNISKLIIQSKSPKEVYKIIKNNKNVVILDVRTPKEYNNEHLENAILINYRSNDFKEKISKLDKNKSYIVYCRSGSRSLGASYMMNKIGFKNITNLKGGINLWKNQLGNKLIKK